MRRRCPGFTPRPPILARAQGWERAALIRAQNMFCCQIVRCKNCVGNDVVQSHPTAVDGNLLHENLQIWSSNQTSWLICGQVYSGGFRRGRMTTVAGHDRSRTSEHVLYHRPPRHYHARPNSLYNSIQRSTRGRVGCLAGN